MTIITSYVLDTYFSYSRTKYISYNYSNKKVNKKSNLNVAHITKENNLLDFSNKKALLVFS